MKITVIGTGYVGLVTGTCLAETGNEVVCVDIDTQKITNLKNGKIPIYEPGLEVLFSRNQTQGNLSFTNSLAEGVAHAEVIFLALSTPPGADGAADLSAILQVAGELSLLIKRYTVVVDKSTVPVGTAEKVAEILAANLEQTRFDVVSNPEFLKEGTAVADFMKPDRVVIGAASPKASAIMAELYQPFVRQGNPIIQMNLRSAEMTKYAANSYLATRISFMNEMANLCEKVGANVDQVRQGMGSDIRIGKRFLFPGIGYGGSCFPKDVQALVRTAQEYDYDFSILKSVIGVNEQQRLSLADKILAHFNQQVVGKTIAVWGLAFKPNTDDIREAPALFIIEKLLAAGAKVVAYDPEAMKNTYQVFGDRITYASSPYEALLNAEALAICTEWNVFRSPSLAVMKNLLAEALIFDGRNIFDPQQMKQAGFQYLSMGRQEITAQNTPFASA